MVVFRKFNPEIHHRRSIRLKGFDYSSPGAYFITINAEGHTRLFGKIENGVMKINDLGVIVSDTWKELLNQNRNISLDASVIMPNHFHGIRYGNVIITNISSGQ
jgi:REP element-mobilizing transposase RayT